MYVFSYFCIALLKYFFMSAIIILIGVSLLVAVGFLVGFLWAVSNGQYDDDYSPSVRILFDDDKSDIIS